MKSLLPSLYAEATYNAYTSAWLGFPDRDDDFDVQATERPNDQIRIKVVMQKRQIAVPIFLLIGLATLLIPSMILLLRFGALQPDKFGFPDPQTIQEIRIQERLVLLQIGLLSIASVVTSIVIPHKQKFRHTTDSKFSFKSFIELILTKIVVAIIIVMGTVFLWALVMTIVTLLFIKYKNVP